MSKQDRSISKNINSRQVILGEVQKELGAINQYQKSSIVRDLLDFYRTPLQRTVTILHNKYHMTYQAIADEVFSGEISKQAVQQNYMIKEAK